MMMSEHDDAASAAVDAGAESDINISENLPNEDEGVHDVESMHAEESPNKQEPPKEENIDLNVTPPETPSTRPTVMQRLNSQRSTEQPMSDHLEKDVVGQSAVSITSPPPQQEQQQPQPPPPTLKPDPNDDTMEKKRPPPVTSRSLNFTSSASGGKRAMGSGGTTRSLTSSSINSYLTSVNDLKYIGEQFLVGKVNPNQKSLTEARFQKMWESKLKKLKSTPNLFSMSTASLHAASGLFNTNDVRHTGNQFKVGKVDPKLVPTCEQRFQKMFKSRLRVLKPDWEQIQTQKPLAFEDLKEMHNRLSVKSK